MKSFAFDRSARLPFPRKRSRRRTRALSLLLNATWPEPAPNRDATLATRADAARLLTQATFGPTRREISALLGAAPQPWLEEQMAMPFSSHRAALKRDHANHGGGPVPSRFNAMDALNRQAAWYKTVVTAPDQLRQRVAFALSELFVVSDIALVDDAYAEPLAHYYDLLGHHAFGNFRALLEAVTLHPVVGLYLSTAGNRGAAPDANFAREIMECFTLGLDLLQPDGTPHRDAAGQPIPAYDPTTVADLAKVFTGWNVTAGDLCRPMTLAPEQHDDSAKTVLGVRVPAGQGGARDLTQALDLLFHHGNTAPFVCRQLIQRLVTSNPSPGYIHRVARTFVDNGAGVRGDLGAVISTILLDDEARSAEAGRSHFGKLKEPLLRFTALLRAFHGGSRSGRYLGAQTAIDGVPIDGAQACPTPNTRIGVIRTRPNLARASHLFGQAPLRARSVSNFFDGDHTPAGRLASAGVRAPELQITNHVLAIAVPNALRDLVYASDVTDTPADDVALTLDLSHEEKLVERPDSLFDHLNVLLCGGGLSDGTRQRAKAALAALPLTTSRRARARAAVLLVATSPDAAVQR